MAKAPAVRSIDVQFHPSGMNLQHASGLITVHTAQTNVLPLTVPWRAKIERLFANIVEAAGTATGTLEYGTVADPNAFLAYNVTTTHALGLIDLTASLVTDDVPAGTILSWSTDGAATTTGIAHAIAILVPWYD